MSSRWVSVMQGIVGKMIDKKDSEPFRYPVNWEELGLVDYLQVVKHPRDLTSIRRKLTKDEYTSKEVCVQDIRLVFTNAMLYNAPGSKIYSAASNLLEYFEIHADKAFGDDAASKHYTLEDYKWIIERLRLLTSEELKSILATLTEETSDYLRINAETNEVSLMLDLVPSSLMSRLTSELDKLLGGAKHGKRTAESQSVTTSNIAKKKRSSI